ncbi:hypothetical protein TPHA_0G01890 [Tetrapisispora phaffii CBS 4417]|uniref:Uncharacterized protein n=1 Tax=Tetrapisispora phaffii (strain ATCC 24235 / CBS 4417 / NBRC 1672 / NRRL Y-8282 / UCD 70-5) TaxID=1071381 RepID=G8BVU7_TETPH|nr:hypothetical protein TPHA_0G01890 [Tetrapisispora phaffii CBS 4417]CCE64025.1 hypothetical protein TPHA_0G01890 [Tetrapisispora phaffii CBS 4417]
MSSNVYQQYKLSVVSGGKPIVPHIFNSSSSKKSVTCLTHNELDYIVPFNNQIKIYSIETRQCIKNLKFANNETLSQIFSGQDDNFVVDIKLNNLLKNQTENSIDESNKIITIFSNHGYIFAVNYKGKMIEKPENIKLSLEEDEEVYKVFHNSTTNEYKLLTTKINNGKSSNYSYRFYKFTVGDKENPITLERTYDDVILSAFSKNDKYLTLLSFESESKKTFIVKSIFDDKVDIKFKQIDLVNASKDTSSANSKYISTMALDNSCTKLALGFASGVINVVNLFDLTSTLLKWHIDTVLSLCFNSDATYLISGGWEKVISFWQLTTNNQQFLPRLNGVVIDCDILGNDKYYSLALQMADNISNSDFQLLLLNATDLQSKLAVNGPLPTFNSPVKNTVHPLSAIKSRASTTISNSSVSKKKFRKKLLKSKKQDYTNVATINPVSKQLFFPHTSAVQIYDFYKNEQVAYQYLAQGVNTAMGKVRYELNIKDPVINDIKFTQNGKWMLTYEVAFPPEDLLSSKDLTYCLKFWTKNDTEAEWRLVTKVLNPHGLNAPITKIIQAPATVNNSEACITSDNNGGLKYWAYDNHEKNWCLKNVALPFYNNYSNSVSLAWSQDGSLIFHGFEDKFTIIDFETFKKLDQVSQNENDRFTTEMNLDSEIQSIKVVNESTVIIATQTAFSSFDLLKGVFVNSFDIYPFTQGVYKNGHLDRLISCDEESGKIAIAINEHTPDNGSSDINYKSRIIIFNSDLSEKTGIFTHNNYVSWLSWNYDTDFIFLDIGCKLGMVGTTVNSEMLDEVNNEKASRTSVNDNNFSVRLSKLTSLKNSLNAGQDKYKKESSAIEVDMDDEDSKLEFINGDNKEGIINMSSFTSMFDNIQNIQMETLFDRVMKVIL